MSTQQQEFVPKFSVDNPQVESRETRGLRQEEAVVWRDDVSDLPYVRELVTHAAPTRTGPLTYRGAGRVVGYTTLRKDAENNGQPREFTRRIFRLVSHDPYEGGGCPVEAVVPSTVAPGVKGTHPSRAKPLT